MDKYFQFCTACGVYEYDCFGVDPNCLTRNPNYRNAHQRAADRKKNHASND